MPAAGWSRALQSICPMLFGNAAWCISTATSSATFRRRKSEMSAGYSYDPAGNVASMTYPSGRIVSFSRDAVGHIAAIATKENASASPEDVATSIAYRPMSDLVASFAYGNGLTYAASFTQDYWPETLKVEDGARSALTK